MIMIQKLHSSNKLFIFALNQHQFVENQEVFHKKFKM
jgi:hypothetical protein